MGKRIIDYKKEIEKASGKRPKGLLNFMKGFVDEGDTQDEGHMDLYRKLFPYYLGAEKTQFDYYKYVDQAIIARAEWEILSLAEEIGESLKEEYSLREGYQFGISLDWEKLSEKFWIPSHFLDKAYVHENNMDYSPKIFSVNEVHYVPWITSGGLFVGGMRNYKSIIERSSEKSLADVVLRPESEQKIQLLLSSGEWRDSAKKYARAFIENINKIYTLDHHEMMNPVLQALINAYRSEMK